MSHKCDFSCNHDAIAAPVGRGSATKGERELQHAFEAAARKELGHSSVDFQRDDDDGYRWAATRSLFKFWRAARDSAAKQPTLGYRVTFPSGTTCIVESLPELEVRIQGWPRDKLKFERLVSGGPHA